MDSSLITLFSGLFNRVVDFTKYGLGTEVPTYTRGREWKETDGSKGSITQKQTAWKYLQREDVIPYIFLGEL